MARRNNSDRISPPMGQKIPGVTPPVMGNDMGFTVPTEFVELPTQGRLYPEGHPLHGKGEVEIRFMTAKDEDILSSQTLLRKGIMLDRFIHSVLIDKTIDPQDLYTGDRNAILVAARITGYGSEYITNVNCPVCNSSSEYEFDIGDYKLNLADDYQQHGLLLTPNGTYTFETPRSKVKLEIRLMDGRVEKYLKDITISKRKNNLLETPLTDLLKMILVTVNGSSDRHHIEQFVENMPAFDSRHLRKIYSKINPGIDLTQDFDCPKCGSRTQLEVPLNADFFWPKH